MTTKSEKLHRPWDPPRGYDEAVSSHPSGVRLYNSLVDEKKLLVPSAGPHSRQLTWYSCGPTVYDSAHLGHSRNYVTFDILRRILQDYFGYSIHAVMNVTDVDDKIILRARRKHLLQQYREERPPLDEVGCCTQHAPVCLACLAYVLLLLQIAIRHWALAALLIPSQP